jgi:hypothetical protein
MKMLLVASEGRNVFKYTVCNVFKYTVYNEDFKNET